MRDYIRRRHQLKAKYPLSCHLFYVVSKQRVRPLFSGRVLDFPKDRDNVSAGTAARVQNVYVLVGEPVRSAELGSKNAIDAFDHVFDDFFRGVPDPQILPERRIVGLEERLIEMLDRLSRVKALEERGLIDAVKCLGSTFKNWHEIKGRKAARLCNFFE